MYMFKLNHFYPHKKGGSKKEKCSSFWECGLLRQCICPEVRSCTRTLGRNRNVLEMISVKSVSVFPLMDEIRNLNIFTGALVSW